MKDLFLSENAIPFPILEKYSGFTPKESLAMRVMFFAGSQIEKANAALQGSLTN